MDTKFSSNIYIFHVLFRKLTYLYYVLFQQHRTAVFFTPFYVVYVDRTTGFSTSFTQSINFQSLIPCAAF